MLAKYMVPVLPVNSDKSPASHLGPRRGVLDATNRPHLAQRWWDLGDARGEEPGLAVATGAAKAFQHGILVVDLDRKGEVDGVATWNSLPPVRRLGWTVDEAIERTIVSETRSGGFHLWFTLDPGLQVASSVGKLANGIDIRGERGYVCAPPTEGYRFLGDREFMAPAPAWLIGALALPTWEARYRSRPRPTTDLAFRRRRLVEVVLSREMSAMRSAPEGTRHRTLYRCVCNMVRAHRKGEGDLDSSLSLLAAAARATGLDDEEVAKAVAAARLDGHDGPEPEPLAAGPIDAPEEFAIIDGWRHWWWHQERWTGSPGLTKKAVAEAVLDQAERHSHRHFTLPKTDLALLTPTSDGTVDRVVQDLTGFMFEFQPGDGREASEFTLLAPPRGDGTPTCSWLGVHDPRASRDPKTARARSAAPAGERAGVSLPTRHHDAFAEPRVGLPRRALLDHLAEATEPETTPVIAKRLGVSWSTANTALTDLEAAGAAVHEPGTGWRLVVSPVEAADRLARQRGIEGILAERLGVNRRSAAKRKHEQAIYASRQKEATDLDGGEN